MSLLKVTIVQHNCIWQDIQANLNHIDSLLQHIPQTDLIVLPEMFTTGFTMDSSDYCTEMDGIAPQWMLAKAKQLHAAVCGSLIVKEGDAYKNRFLFCEPNGTMHHYDKKHLFRMANEHEHYSAGNERIVINYKDWRIAPFICYDLRFPIWLHRTAEFDYDLLLFVANWPDKRGEHWKLLLNARAVENQSYVVGVNRVGVDDLGTSYAGDSKAILPWGEDLCILHGSEQVHTLTLFKDAVESYREQFPVHLDDDPFQIV